MSPRAAELVVELVVVLETEDPMMTSPRAATTELVVVLWTV